MKSFKKASEMCGAAGVSKRVALQLDVDYLDSFVKGVYTKNDLLEKHIFFDEDAFLSTSHPKGQISCRELMCGERVQKQGLKDQPITVDMMDSPYADNPNLEKSLTGDYEPDFSSIIIQTDLSR